MVRRRDLNVTVGSNGLMLTTEMARDLVKLGVDRLVISVDGSSQRPTPMYVVPCCLKS